jgi:multiple sugar transport system ATP-binding protein
MARVIFQNVTKLYGGNPVPAVNDLSMEAEDQEFLVLVGPSGCGKSTAMRMVAGLEEISGGQIIIGDRVVNDLPPKDRDVAMVFQSYALYPHMSVYDNLAYPLKLRKVPKVERDQRVREAARTLDIEQFLDRKPKALSGGQRQRVALGRAIVRNADVFLMDEPLSNLDAKLGVERRQQVLDGLQLDAELRRNLAVRVTLNDESYDLDLSRSQIDTGHRFRQWRGTDLPEGGDV